MDPARHPVDPPCNPAQALTRPGGVACVAGLSVVLLLVLTGTVAATGPGSLAGDSGRRSAAMLMATLQDAARQLADAREAPASATPRASSSRVVAVAPLAAQTPRHLPPPPLAFCVLPPPAA